MTDIVQHTTIKDCQKGKSTAFEELYKGCAPFVFSIIKRYIRRQSDHKDVMQEIFARVFMNISKYDQEKGLFKFWLRRVSVNQCLQYLRKNKKELHWLSLDSLESNHEPSYNREIQLSENEIETILQKMPTGYKTVFMLTVFDGYNHKEVSELLDISAETSRSQLTRARKWLQKEFNGQAKKVLYGLL